MSEGAASIRRRSWIVRVCVVWVLQWGLIACVGIVPLAVIAGSIRGLPLGWQLIDISFGVVAAIPLTIAIVLTRRIERAQEHGWRRMPLE